MLFTYQPPTTARPAASRTFPPISDSGLARPPRPNYFKILSPKALGVYNIVLQNIRYKVIVMVLILM